MLFFKLPTELIRFTLSLLSPQEIDHLFSINEIFSCPAVPNDPYFKIRLIALQEYFSNRKLILSNSDYHIYDLEDVNITLQQLEFLKRENIMVNPREFSIFINYRITDEVNFIEKHKSLIKFVTSWSTKIKLQLEGTDEPENQYLIEEILCSIADIDYKLDLLSLKHGGRSPKLESSDFTINVTNLKLQLGGCHEFLYTIHTKECFKNVTSLDLSYNGISDISRIKFPPSLINLNLSNNTIFVINDSSFDWKGLVNLETLDLSNNNIHHFSLRGTSENSYQLTRLKLSGNHLTIVPKLYQSKLFHKLIDLDLSRNMLCGLHKFPGCLIKLSLRGNYLSQFHSQASGDIFPKTLTHLDLSHCRICCQLLTTQDISNHLVTVEKLYRLSDLQIEGF
ncbi:hypothetical protein JA1_002361 [Spathaspora sp. JA1]|nr:hypothetical protein JA1_002361 [Spathaspora sp. JA1]